MAVANVEALYENLARRVNVSPTAGATRRFG